MCIRCWWCLVLLPLSCDIPCALCVCCLCCVPQALQAMQQQQRLLATQSEPQQQEDEEAQADGHGRGAAARAGVAGNAGGVSLLYGGETAKAADLAGAFGQDLVGLSPGARHLEATAAGEDAVSTPLDSDTQQSGDAVMHAGRQARLCRVRT